MHLDPAMQSDLSVSGFKINILKLICIYRLVMRHPLGNFAAMRSEWKLCLLLVVYETYIQKKNHVNYQLLQLFDFEAVFRISFEFLLKRKHIKKQNHKGRL